MLGCCVEFQVSSTHSSEDGSYFSQCDASFNAIASVRSLEQCGESFNIETDFEIHRNNFSASRFSPGGTLMDDVPTGGTLRVLGVWQSFLRAMKLDVDHEAPNVFLYSIRRLG